MNVFLLWQAVVTYIQIQYQKKRHYTRKALAKKSDMDPTATEVLDEKPHDMFYYLVPCLYATYLGQLIFGIWMAVITYYSSAAITECIQVSHFCFFFHFFYFFFL